VYLVWVGQTTNEHLRSVFLNRVNPNDAGPSTNCSKVCCESSPQSQLLDQTEVLSDYHLLHLNREVSDGLRSRAVGGTGAGGGVDPRSISECSFDSSTTYSTRLGQLSVAAGDETGTETSTSNSYYNSSSSRASTQQQLPSTDRSVGATHAPFHVFGVGGSGGSQEKHDQIDEESGAPDTSQV
jgi:hypothetical protein